MSKECKEILCFVGPSGAGKDTIVNKIRYLMDVSYYSLSNKIREQASLLGLENLRRDELQIFANKLREQHGNGIFASLSKKNIIEDPNKIIIVNGVRHPSEINLLREIEYTCLRVIGVTASSEVRFKRVVERGRQSDPKTWESFMECDRRENGIPGEMIGQQNDQCLKIADIIIDNNGSVEELDYLVERLYSRLTAICFEKCSKNVFYNKRGAGL
ncbi:MAG: AAA family ATPase [Candidatus Daviesbacteria bacterium]|nr:AAA family ATPase [Candidatus Daviesbacteria bacterium]